MLAIAIVTRRGQALGPRSSPMPRVTFTANLQRHLDAPSLEVDGACVGEVLAGVFARKPLLRSYIVDDQGRLRRHVNVFVNTALIVDRDRSEERRVGNECCSTCISRRSPIPEKTKTK